MRMSSPFRWNERLVVKVTTGSAAFGAGGSFILSASITCGSSSAFILATMRAGRPAWRLDGEGRRVGPAIAHGELLFAGPCMMASASTVPYYGLGLKAFPWADRASGQMQVRVVSSIGVATLALNLHRIWSGDFSHEGLLDFHADRVALRFEKPMPLQVGGDAEGWRDELGLGMARPVELVDFQPLQPLPN